jgi:HPt (histidine-containing phosphotransfer) domain-containing protein
LNEISEGDKEFEKELIELYKEACTEKITLLEESLKEAHPDNTILYSHDIKGSSSNIGAEAVRKISERMEILCREHRYKEAYDMLQELQQELTATYSAFDLYLQES